MGWRDIHLPTAAASAVLAAIAGTGAVHLGAPQPVKVIERQVDHQAVGKYGWGEMTPAEQARAVASIGDMDRREVQIFCGNSGCDDLAEDVDEVFDQVHAASNVQKPLLELGAGMLIAPDEPVTRKIAATFKEATGGRVDMKVSNDKVQGGGIIILLGRKPRH